MSEKNIKDKPIYTAAKVPKSTFSTWRTSLKNPDPDTLPEIANVLGVSLQWLITGEDPPLAEPAHPEDEKKLLQYYRESNPDGKDIILKTAYAISGTHPVNLLISRDGSS